LRDGEVGEVRREEGENVKRVGKTKRDGEQGGTGLRKTTKPNQSEFASSQIGSCLQYHIREALDSNVLGL